MFSTFYEEETFISSSCFSEVWTRDDLKLAQINLDKFRFLFASWAYPPTTEGIRAVVCIENCQETNNDSHFFSNAKVTDHHEQFYCKSASKTSKI